MKPCTACYAKSKIMVAMDEEDIPLTNDWYYICQTCGRRERWTSDYTGSYMVGISIIKGEDKHD